MESLVMRVVVALVCVFSVGSQGSSKVELLGPESVSVEQHTEIRLTCRVPIATTQVTWKRGSTTITADATKKIKIDFVEETANSHDSVLTIAEAEQTDSGAYRCYGDDDTQSVKTVNVHVTENEISLTATKKRVTLVPGSPLTLTCQADIHTHVEWRKGSTAINNGDGVTISEETDSNNDHIKTSKLTFTRTTASHAGTYVCQNEHHIEDNDDITVLETSDTSGQSSASELSTILLGSVLVLALLR